MAFQQEFGVSGKIKGFPEDRHSTHNRSVELENRS